ncbi:MAG: hypothetical protein QN175_09250, partial [Armatimonadota bacterium]|nr:hypothetical protein [Armatimonadota bacterium]
MSDIVQGILGGLFQGSVKPRTCKHDHCSEKVLFLGRWRTPASSGLLRVVDPQKVADCLLGVL